jgi:2-methylcitrate dehydratase PrpD
MAVSENSTAKATIAARLADFIIAVRWENVEVRVRHEVKRSFLNWLGCAIGGSRHGSIAIAQRALMPVSGPPQATIIGRRQRTDVLTAALLNCTSSSVYGFDDTHAETILHPTGPVASALFALSETTAISGSDFQLALLLGVDIESRLSKAIAVAPARCKVGWYLTGLTGGVGAAAAAGLALGLTAKQIVWAMGIASGQGAGNRAMHAAMTSALVPGHAAACGLRAALLAQAGFTCGDNFIENPNGFLGLFAEQSNADALSADLGRRYEIMATNYKPWPCGIVLHAMVDACLGIHRDHRLALADIERIDVTVHPTAITLGNRPHPLDDLQAIVSLHHWAAATLARGQSGIDVLDPAVIGDAEIVEIRNKVHAIASNELAPNAARVVVTTTSGAELKADVEHCLGSATRPMSDRDLEDKFRAQCIGVVDDKCAEQIIAECWHLDQCSTVAELGQLAA